MQEQITIGRARLVYEWDGEATMTQIVCDSHFLRRLYVVHIQLPLQLAIAMHMTRVPIHTSR